MKKIMNACCERFTGLNFIPLLLTRLTIGVIFAGSGLGKFRHLDKVIEFFSSLGMPYPQFLTPFTAFFELFCGILVLLGLATRFAAVPLIMIMLVAIRTAKWEEVTGIYSIFQLSEFLYIVLLVWLITQGAGKFSIDYFIKKKLSK